MPLYDDSEGGEDLLFRASTHFQAGRVWDAVHELEKHLAAHPGDPLAHALMANYLRFVHRRRESERHLREALRRGPREALVNLIAGKIALDDGEPERAEEHLLTALDTVPQDEHGRWLLAEAQLRKGEVDAALDVAERALKDHPESAALWAITGRCRQAARRDDARAALERAIELDASQADALHALGELHLEVAQFDQAAECFRRAVEANAAMDVSRRLLVRTHFWRMLSDDSDRMHGAGRAALFTVVIVLALLLFGMMSMDALAGRSLLPGVALLLAVSAGIVGYYVRRFVQARAKAHDELR